MALSTFFIKAVSVIATGIMFVCYFKISRLMNILSRDLKAKWQLLLYIIYVLTAIYLFITLVVIYANDVSILFHIFPWILLLGAAFIYVFSDTLLEMRQEGKTVIHLATAGGTDTSRRPTVRELAAGTTLIVEEEKRHRSLTLFSELLKKGMKGLCITRTNPQNIRENYLTIDVPILWLTEVKSEQSIAPSLEEIAHRIQEFIGKTEGDTVVYFDGIEYLAQSASFNLVLQLVDRLKDVIAVADSRLIISLNPITFTEKELSLLERSADVV